MEDMEEVSRTSAPLENGDEAVNYWEDPSQEKRKEIKGGDGGEDQAVRRAWGENWRAFLMEEM